MADLFTADELADYLQGQPVDVNLAGLLAAGASGVIITTLGYDPTATTVTRILDAPTGPLLVLPDPPVVAVTAVTVEGVVLDPAGYQWNEIGLLARVDGQRWHTKSPGFAAVTVDYIRPDTVPAVVKQAALSWAARQLANPESITSETIGGYSVTYGQGALSGLTDSEAGLLSSLRTPVTA